MRPSCITGRCNRPRSAVAERPLRSKPFSEEVVEAEEPRLLAFNGYGSEVGSEVSVVQVHPDPESMLFHMQVAREHIERATGELLDVRRIDV